MERTQACLFGKEENKKTMDRNVVFFSGKIAISGACNASIYLNHNLI